MNNTGGPPPTPAAGQDAAIWRTSFEQMILSVIVITDRVLPGMRERGWGRILTSTSGGALSPIPNLAISNTLRASLHTWSKTLCRRGWPRRGDVATSSCRAESPLPVRNSSTSAERSGRVRVSTT